MTRTYNRKSETAKLADTHFTGLQHVPTRQLQPFTTWRNGSIIQFCKTESDANKSLIRSKPAPIKVPIPLPVPLPLHGDNGGKNKGGSHHKRYPTGRGTP